MRAETTTVIHAPGHLHLTGLDGSNPLGFLAAVGLLRVLDDATPAALPRPTLVWADSGQWLPWLQVVQTQEQVLDIVVQHARASLAEAATCFSYDAEGRASLRGDGLVRDLKPLPEGLRALQDAAAVQAIQDPPSAVRRRSVDWMAAFGSECVTDNNGRVKPGALHFTAGQQAFLTMVREQAEGLDTAMVAEALFGPWVGTSRLPSLSWNAAAARGYAYRATDPSKEKRSSVPSADVLAFAAWTLLPSVSDGRRLRTARCAGGWKDGTFSWPVWTVPCTAQTVASLMVRRDIDELTAAERRALGVGLIFRSSVTRSDQGGYGSFAPAAVL